MSNNLVFWVLIIFFTGLAWLCLALPLRAKSSSQTGFLGRFFLILFPVYTLGLYFLFGNSGQLNQFWSWQKQNVEVQKRLAEVKTPELIDQLSQHLQQDPASAKGWFLLGKLYLDQRRFSEAESALDHAYKLEPHSSEYLLALAKADFFKNKAHLNPTLARQLINMLRLKSIDEPLDALNLLAVDAYQQKNYRQAVRYWQQALALLQPESPDSRTLLDMISQAQRLEQNIGVNNGRNN